MIKAALGIHLVEGKNIFLFFFKCPLMLEKVNNFYLKGRKKGFSLSAPVFNCGLNKRSQSLNTSPLFSGPLGSVPGSPYPRH